MIEKDITESVQKITPAVVSIVITKDLPKIKQYLFFPYGFDSGWAIPQYRQEGFQKVKVGGGSGFIVSSDGLILTNRHVVADEQANYTVVTSNDKKYEAKVVARDPINDVAILKINAKNLPTLELGDATKLKLGQPVIAVGNALGQFRNTVSTGVISGLSRYISATTGLGGQKQELRGLIQTDAAINFGNSGGPLVDLEGKVIGINAAIVFGAQNIGFAIPVNAAKKALEDVKKHGRIITPSLGVRYILLNKDLQEQENLPVNYGALIVPEYAAGGGGIVPGSPADKAGLQEYDIILEFNGIKVDNKNPLVDLIQRCRVGEEVKLKVLRDDQKIILKAVLEERK